MISVVVPSYKNPEYLGLCLECLLKFQKMKNNEIVVVVDGFVDMYSTMMGSFPQVKWLWLDENQGLPMATNVGVFNASNEKILLINEDNIAPVNWDVLLDKMWEPNTVYAVQQIEPEPSIFNFLQMDAGKTPHEFSYEQFANFEYKSRKNLITDDAYTLPIFMSKKWFLAVNGWDTSYASPFVVDLDFFLKLQLLWTLDFKRLHQLAFYHFGSRSTKRRSDGETSWSDGEIFAAQQFQYKWGILPQRLPNNRVNMQGLRGIS